jgi:hypothetical protein
VGNSSGDDFPYGYLIFVIIIALLFVLILPVMGFMLMDMMENRREVQISLHKIEKLRKEIENEKREK